MRTMLETMLETTLETMLEMKEVRIEPGRTEKERIPSALGMLSERAMCPPRQSLIRVTM